MNGAVEKICSGTRRPEPSQSHDEKSDADDVTDKKPPRLARTTSETLGTPRVIKSESEIVGPAIDPFSMAAVSGLER